MTRAQERKAREAGYDRIIEHADDEQYQARMRQLRRENAERVARAALAR